jgi:hypothetical protein
MSIIENITDSELDDKKWGFTVEFIATAFVGLIVRWANNGMKEDPAEYVTQIRGIFDGSIDANILLTLRAEYIAVNAEFPSFADESFSPMKKSRKTVRSIENQNPGERTIHCRLPLPQLIRAIGQAAVSQVEPDRFYGINIDIGNHSGSQLIVWGAGIGNHVFSSAEKPFLIFALGKKQT